MKPASLSLIKSALNHRNEEELRKLCISLARHKLENKELLSYLLFDADDEDEYIRLVNEEVSHLFAQINNSNLYYIKKGVRKILRLAKKQIRFSKEAETEVAILLHFLSELKEYASYFDQSTAFRNLYDRQLQQVKKKLKTLHPDVQYDYKASLTEL